jgi:hypothetical protein
MRLLALLLLTLGLASCVPAEGNTPQAATETRSIPTDEQSCKAAGATWRRVCLMGNWTCVVSYADAGKTCRDGDECQGKQCRHNGKPVEDPNQEVTGKCVATSDPCGCFALVEDGKVEAALCVD